MNVPFSGVSRVQYQVEMWYISSVPQTMYHSVPRPLYQYFRQNKWLSEVLKKGAKRGCRLADYVNLGVLHPRYPDNFIRSLAFTTCKTEKNFVSLV